jgi:hypothetical protein
MPQYEAVATHTHLPFERIGEVRPKGFSAATEVFLARSTGSGRGRCPQEAV